MNTSRRALADIGFEGRAQLETDSPVSAEADMRQYLRIILGLIAAGSLGKIIKTRGGFPNEEAALKLLFLALRQAAKKWTIPIHH